MGIEKSRSAGLFRYACFKSLLIAFIIIFNSITFTAYANDITRSTRYAALVLDSATGKVIYSKNAHDLRYPASLTKLMTVYLAFEALESGKLTMNQQIVVSDRASREIPRKLGLKAGERITVRDCIYSTIVISANDSASVLAEAIAGSQWSFAKMMTKKAKALGMTRTNFANAHGCHDKNQYTTATDMAKLALALKKKFPKYYSLFSKTTITYKGKVLNGHNHVTKRYAGAEGLKTGYIRTSGFNLITTAKKPHGHLVGVVFGGENAKIRDDHMIKILDLGFCHLSENKGIYNPKCIKKSPVLVAANNAAASHKSIFSIVDNIEPIKTASLDSKKVAHLLKTKKSKQLIAQNEIKDINPLSIQSIGQDSKNNKSKKARI
ncbi:penicillin-binding protein dacF [endosymbiont of Acanthamoeba sp. UWC8]|uniref:D-alanyl-D-alanine carboxypeptidase family protein n=1 Tax=endosymbiont of Acanthamoeba sp. UWC8 TaxID=86106 RepID=UPI0004D1916D|nr:D-alanyl-D-alanine carboxypeptidase family protein [endosymbiont of Acanthamoeba sp. UWC8]AIF81498.1 penicillin-binding protein dacF [endosymbiont of Acanthamoeba sp. UWC8]